jgi:predicted metal-dependent phosphoesterase TrpH
MSVGLIDLHLHTTASDGYYPTAGLIDKLRQAGIRTFSITDHDTFDALDEAGQLALRYDMELIPGTELSASHEGREVHILAYFVDRSIEEFNSLLTFFKQERTHRAERILRRLQQKGFAIEIDDVLNEAHGAPITRPHIANTMLKKEFVKSFQEAFYLYLANNAPCYEPKVYVSPDYICETISKCGGLSFIAHPGNLPEDLILHCIKAGIDGLEVTHPSHGAEQTKFLRKLAESYFLLTSGGSDFHGGGRNDEHNIGKYCPSHAEVEAMKKRLTRKKLA